MYFIIHIYIYILLLLLIYTSVMTPDNKYLGCKFGRLGPMFLWTLVSHDLAFKINRSMAVEIILYCKHIHGPGFKRCLSFYNSL